MRLIERDRGRELRFLVIGVVLSGMGLAAGEGDGPKNTGESGPRRESDRPSFEYQIKAELLERMSRFIEWPNLSQDTLFVIGIVGRNPFGKFLDQVAREKGFKGRRTIIREFTLLEGVEECHIVFISRDGVRHLEKVQGRIRGRPVLTVGDTPGLADAGVIVNLATERRHLRLEINAAQAKASGLRVSPKLLRLGRVVGGER